MLTEAQIELVARRYCVLRGIDPELPVPQRPNPLAIVISREVRLVPAWQAAAEFVRQRAAMDEAFRILDIVAFPAVPVSSPSPTTDHEHDRTPGA